MMINSQRLRKLNNISCNKNIHTSQVTFFLTAVWYDTPTDYPIITNIVVGWVGMHYLLAQRTAQLQSLLA